MPRKITYPEIYEIVKSTIAAITSAPTSYVISGTVTIDLKKYQDAILKLDFKEFVDTALSIGTTSTNVGDLNKIFNINQNKENIYVPDANGGSIFLNGDRIIINSKNDFSMLFGQKGVAIASPERVNIDAGSSITLFSPENLYLGLPNKGQKIDEVQKTQKQSGNTKGDPTPDYAYEPLVLGMKLANLLEDIIVAVTTGDMVGGLSDASWQPSTIAEFELLANRLPEIISTYAYVDGISHSEINEETLSMLKAKQKATKPYVPPTTLTATVVGQITPPITGNFPNNDPNNPSGIAMGVNTIVPGGGGYPVNQSTTDFINKYTGGVNPVTLYADGTMQLEVGKANNPEVWSQATINAYETNAPKGPKRVFSPLIQRHWLQSNPSYMKSLAKVTIPLAGGKTVNLPLHPDFVAALQAPLAEIAQNGGREYILTSAGGWASRNVTNGLRLTNHSYGFAFDINSTEVGFKYGAAAWNFTSKSVGATPWTPFQEGFYNLVGSVMIKHGIKWLYKMDPMHFSIHE